MAQNYPNIPSKSVGQTLTAVEFNNLVSTVSGNASDAQSRLIKAGGGYEFTAGFSDRATGSAGASDEGTTVVYTQGMADSGIWLRFGFSPENQATLDTPYWTAILDDEAPGAGSTDYSGVGLFGGAYFPEGVSGSGQGEGLFDFGDVSDYNDAVLNGGLLYTGGETGSLNYKQCQVGDLALTRFDFNLVPTAANTSVEIALIWQTRDTGDNGTFTFPLTADAIFFGEGSVGKTFLTRPILSAYFASNEDVNARALPAIRANQRVEIQPLSLLSTIQR